MILLCRIADSTGFQPFLGFTLHNLHWLLTVWITARPLSCVTFSPSNNSLPLWTHCWCFFFHLHTTCSLRNIHFINSLLYWSQAQRSHQTSTQTCIHQPFAKETILLLSDRWLGIYDMHQLTWLAPHNELGDGDCHHLLIIPMVEILSVMSYATIPASYETVTVLYILYCHFQMVGGPTRVIKNHKQPHSLTTNR